MTVALGLELSSDYDMAAVAVAAQDGGKWMAEVMWYGNPDGAVAECSRLYTTLEDNCGLFADPQPCGGILDDLRASGCWLHLLEFTDVGAAAWQFVTEARGRRLKLGSTRR
jgi:hypothetical protein